MLKLEPTEAENTLLPNFSMAAGQAAALASEIDDLLRAGQEEQAQEVSDRAILRGKLNLTKTDCDTLRGAVTSLQRRRL